MNMHNLPRDLPRDLPHTGMTRELRMIGA